MKEPLLYRIVRPILTFLFRFFYFPTYYGLENIPKNGSFVLAGNHTHFFDCLLLISATKRPIHFLAKDDLAKGLKKYIFLAMGIIPVNRSIHDSKALEQAKLFLRERKVIGIFPEGTINRTDKFLLPFKIGAVKMAHDTNSYLVPFVIKGKYKLFHRSVQITFYKPYFVSSSLEQENKDFMEMMENELKKEKKK